jgi:hypothetical protein
VVYPNGRGGSLKISEGFRQSSRVFHSDPAETLPFAKRFHVTPIEIVIGEDSESFGAIGQATHHGQPTGTVQRHEARKAHYEPSLPHCALLTNR